MTTKKKPWETDNWYVSHWNFNKDVTKDFKPPQQLKVHDVTLRDGEQEPGIVFNLDDKIRIAEKLAELGVQRIEGGMVAVSQEDRDAIKEMARRNLGPDIFCFCRAMEDDIKMALDCGADGVVIEIPGAERCICARGKTVEWAIDSAVTATRFAHEQGLKVSFFTIDASRAEEDFYFNFIEKVGKDGHYDGVVVVDTFGVMGPHAAYQFTKKIKERIDKPLEVHFHNNFGLAVANTIAAVLAGGEVIHTTINGIGGGSGNCPMEETVISLLALYGIDAGLNYGKIFETTKLLSELTGRPIPPNRPFVGGMIYTDEIGIAAAVKLAAKQSGQPPASQTMNPAFVGHKPGGVAMGKKAGSANIQLWAEEMGIELTKDEIREILEQVKTKGSDLKRLLTRDEFRAITEKVKGR